MPELFSAALRNPVVANLILSSFTIPQLCDIALTSKDVRAQLMPHIWGYLVFYVPGQAFRAFLTIAGNPEIGPHVRTLKFHPTRQHVPLYSDTDNRTFYTALARALAMMVNLEQFFMDDITASVLQPSQHDAHSWIVPSGGEIKTLNTLCYGLSWDARLDSFLDVQTNIRWLQAPLAAPTYSVTPPPDPMPWPHLIHAEVDVIMATRICGAPLKNFVLHMRGADNSAEDVFELLGNVLPRLAGHRTLRGFMVRNIAKSVSPDIVAATAQALPHLKYLGVLQLSALDRSALLTALTAFSSLEVLEVDCGRFDPPPGMPAQRALAFEMRSVLPKLAVFACWYLHGHPAGMHRVVWRFDEHADCWRVDQNCYRRSGWDILGGQV